MAGKGLWNITGRIHYSVRLLINPYANSQVNSLAIAIHRISITRHSDNTHFLRSGKNMHTALQGPSCSVKQTKKVQYVTN